MKKNIRRKKYPKSIHRKLKDKNKFKSIPMNITAKKPTSLKTEASYNIINDPNIKKNDSKEIMLQKISVMRNSKVSNDEKFRIYQLSKLFHISSEALISILRSFGHEVKSHMSVVTDEMIKSVIDTFLKEEQELAQLGILFENGKFRIVRVTKTGLLLPLSSNDDGNKIVGYLSLLSKQEKALGEFEELISNIKITEREISNFLYEHQELFELLGYENAIKEVVLEKTEFNEERRIDFLLKPIGEDFYDILELKKPKYQTYLNVRGIPGFTAKVYRALEQARRYRTIINEEQEVRNKLEKEGIKCNNPTCIVFIGYDNDKLNISEKKEKKHSISPDIIYAYNELTTKMKNIIKYRNK